MKDVIFIKNLNYDEKSNRPFLKISSDTLLKNNYDGNKDKDNDKNADHVIFPSGVDKRYKALINSLSFDEENKLEDNLINYVQITPYELMFEVCCKKKNAKNKAKYELIKKCKNILEKSTGIEYMIKKNFESTFVKQHILNPTELNMFKYHFKSLNMLNYEASMSYLKRIKSEGVETLKKEELISQALAGNKQLFDVFYDYYTN